MRKPIALRDQSRLWSKKMCSLSPHSNTPKIDVYETHEKMLNIAYYQRNANQNYNEILPHTGQNDHHQKVYKQ